MNHGRIAYGREIMAICAGLFLKNNVSYWLEELEKIGCPAAQSTIWGKSSPTRNALTFSETPVKDYRFPSRLGQHTWEILSATLGYNDPKIAELKQAGQFDSTTTDRIANPVHLGRSRGKSPLGVLKGSAMLVSRLARRFASADSKRPRITPTSARCSGGGPRRSAARAMGAH